MIFKPRIFISSTLNENLSVRLQLENFYSSVGAEALLYEKNLTPSVNPMTYRKDILDADFIILIIKNKYGARTERGISGTHEELQIAIETNIPLHVYIRLEEGERDAKKLIDEINNNKISFYYFKNDKDLLKRIKETTFTIAKEIMLKKVEDAQLPNETIKRLSVKHDYEKALQIIKIIETMIKVNRVMNLDFVDSTLVEEFIDPIEIYHYGENWTFIDRKIEEIVNDLLTIYKKYEDHGMDYSAISGTYRTIKVPVLGEVSVSRCSVCNNPRLSRDDYQSIIEEFLTKYSDFKKYIETIRLSADILI